MSTQEQIWNPGGETEVQCRHCNHQWTYSGMTPYAQCPKCQKSNKLEVE